MRMFILTFVFTVFSTVLSTLVAAQDEAPRSKRDEQADTLLERGLDKYEAGDRSAAFEIWSEIREHYPNTESWPSAVYNIGILLKGRREFDRAIEKFLEVRNADVNDKAPHPNLMEAYRNYRHNAQTQIASSYQFLGDYAKALSAYELAQSKYPYESFCGTCLFSHGNDLTFEIALCLDGLGDGARALVIYLRSPDEEDGFRIVELYEQSGQLDALRALLDAIDAMPSEGARIFDRDVTMLDNSLETSPARTALRLRDAAAAGDWPVVIEFIEKTSASIAAEGKKRFDDPLVFPLSEDEYSRHRLLAASARLLSKYGTDPVAAIDAASRVAGDAQPWFWYALGQSRTQAGVDALLASAQSAADDESKASALVYCLRLAGPLGEPAIESLARSDSPSIRSAVFELRSGGLDDELRVERPRGRSRTPLAKVVKDLAVERWRRSKAKDSNDRDSNDRDSSDRDSSDRDSSERGAGQ